MEWIYLDHAASTPVHPEAAEAMLQVMRGQVGNASSVHAFGRSAKRVLNGARDQIAAFLGCRPEEWIFTGGGTEADNMAVFGATALSAKGHVITSRIEHHAVLHACERLEAEGWDVTYLPVDHTGRIAVDDVEAALRPDTRLISIMYVNNEVGTIQPVREIGELASARGIPFHVDAVQALGALPLNLAALPVDYMSFSAHKINGPQGVGGLYARSGAALSPRAYGGLQERGRRAGTENLAGAAGFAAAVGLAAAGMEDRRTRSIDLRGALLQELEQRLGPERYRVNGNPDHYVPNIINVSFPEMRTDMMLMNLDMEKVAASSGSACTSGSLEVSHVLRAMSLSSDLTESAIRFSTGLGNTTEEMQLAAQKVETILNRLRKRG